MKHKPINCEASVKIYNKIDCAYHARLGWSKTEWHTHKKGQLIYAEHGIMRLYTEEKAYYIPSWHAAWIPQGVMHRVVTESVNIIFRTLYLDYNKLNDTFYKKVSVFYANPLMREMILYTERFNLDDAATSHETSFLEAIKQLLSKQAGQSIALQLPTTEHPQLLEITNFLQEHIDYKLKAGNIAAEFGMSERTMSRLFQKEFSMPLIQYLKLLRIIHAVEMLVLPGKNVSEVAYAVGYESLTTFSNNFNEVMGVRPNLFLQK
ncbi:MAG: helix-turn-helix domain-containing protein [Sphingobacteriales bacterium]